MDELLDDLFQTNRDTARAVALNDDLLVAGQEGNNGRVKVGYQLEQHEIRVDILNKLGLTAQLGHDIQTDVALAVDRTGKRCVDRAERVHALAVHLDYVITADNLSVQHSCDTDITRTNDAERVEQVALGIRTGHADGSDQIFLSIGAQHADGQRAAGQDNRLVEVAQHVIEQRRRIAQRIGTVCDDKAIIQIVIFTDDAGQLDTVCRCDIGRVDGERILYDNLADLGQLG